MSQKIEEELRQPEKPVEQILPEVGPSPELKESEAQIIKTEQVEQISSAVKKSQKISPSSAETLLVSEKSVVLKEIERILSEGMEETYKNLPDNLKRAFKEKGEETASKIEQLISQAKVIVHKIVDLIKMWLLMIPGVNKFFIEQETKIKTGKILELAEKQKKDKIL